MHKVLLTWKIKDGVFQINADRDRNQIWDLDVEFFLFFKFILFSCGVRVIGGGLKDKQRDVGKAMGHTLFFWIKHPNIPIIWCPIKLISTF